MLVLLFVGQYFSKSCVPGALSHYYNPYKTNPISLCEACETRGPKRCLRNDEELNYGASGAFRCLTQCKFHVPLCENKYLKRAKKVYSLCFFKLTQLLSPPFPIAKRYAFDDIPQRTHSFPRPPHPPTSKGMVAEWKQCL